MQESVYLAALVSQRWMSGRAEPPDIYLGCTKTSKGGTKGMLDRGRWGSWGCSGWAWILLISTWSGWVVCLGLNSSSSSSMWHTCFCFFLLFLSPVPPLSASPLSLLDCLFEEEGTWALWRPTNKSNKCLLLNREQPLTIGILGERQQNESRTHFVWGKLYLQLTITFTQEEKCVKL